MTEDEPNREDHPNLLAREIVLSLKDDGGKTPGDLTTGLVQRALGPTVALIAVEEPEEVETLVLVFGGIAQIAAQAISALEAHGHDVSYILGPEKDPKDAERPEP